MVAQYRERLTVVQIVTPGLAGVHQREEFLLVWCVSGLGRFHLRADVRHRLQTVAVILHQTCTDRIAAGVAMNDIWQFRVSESEDRCIAQHALQLFKCALLRFAPFPFHFVLCQLGQRQGDLAILFEEAAVVAGQAQEGAQLADVCRGRPLLYRINLMRIHCESVAADAVAEEFDLGQHPFAFTRLEIQLLAPQHVEDLAQMRDVFRLGA